MFTWSLTTMPSLLSILFFAGIMTLIAGAFLLS